VLIVDDDPDVRGILGTVLRHLSLSVDVASDGMTALALLAEHRYAVVLLDLMMPDVDGFTVLEAIHGAGVAEPPVVIVVSGADRALLNRVDSDRVHGVIRKPFEPQEIAEVVAACVEIRGRNALGTMALAGALSSVPIFAMLKW
jgi:two-component system, OmpR family, response regulator